MARFTSDPFNLSPGFEAEGKQITQAVVRLLTNNEREIASTAIRGKQLQEIKLAESQLRQANASAKSNAQPEELNVVQSVAISQRIERKHLTILAIECFITDSGARIDDRTKIEQYYGLLLETDEETIAAEQEALVNKYRREDFRIKYKCPACQGTVDPASAVRL